MSCDYMWKVSSQQGESLFCNAGTLLCRDKGSPRNYFISPKEDEKVSTRL